jgi:S-formylglutathione hydrolase FrmB
MMRRYAILPIVMLLAGCQGASPEGAVTPSPAATATLPAVCGDPGTTQRLAMDMPKEGYDYEYALYLPPCYEAETGQTYPVLFLIPGRSSSFQAWFLAGAAEVADEMIHQGKIPPFIIVATADTDYDMQAELIHYTLIPYIERSYRVKPERRYHAVAGGSLGGVAAYRIVFRDPGHFASAGIFGNGATDGEEERIRGWLAAMDEDAKPRVFLNVGFADTYMLERAQVMVSILDEFQIFHTEIFSDGDHSYPYWVDNFDEYLLWMAEDWR